MPKTDPTTVLDITEIGYQKALNQDPLGLRIAITNFKVLSNVMPAENNDLDGIVVYEDEIEDYYKAQGNRVIVYVCFLPEKLEIIEKIEAIQLFLEDGTLFAQKIFRNAFEKELYSPLYLYCAITFDGLIEELELEIKDPSPFPQINNYCDLPIPKNSHVEEYIVTNGHCGIDEDYPKYYPMLAVLGSSLPKTPIYPLEQCFLDEDSGVLSEGEYYYKVSALLNDKETLANVGRTIYLEPIDAPENLRIFKSSGTLDSGNYDYAVTSVMGNGETLLSDLISITTEKLTDPVPDFSFTLDVGQLKKGTYSYRKSFENEYGTTLATNAQTFVINEDNSGIVLSWPLPSEDVKLVKIFGRVGGDERLIATLSREENSFYDWGNFIEAFEQLPPSVNTTNGILLKWDDVPKARKFRIYGRNAGDMRFLLEVSGSTYEFYDNGLLSPGNIAPTSNTTATGVKVKWTKKENATGYKIYGRTKNNMGLIGTVGDVEEFIDNGVTAPGNQLPIENNTSKLEWQLLDGTLLYRGPAETMSRTRFTIGANDTGNKLSPYKDYAYVGITNGTGVDQYRHIKFSKIDNEFIVIDKEFTVIPDNTSEFTIWAGPGCCGGGCGEKPSDEEIVITTPGEPIILPPVEEQYYGLGVHFSGNFLGNTTVNTGAPQNNSLEKIRNWHSRLGTIPTTKEKIQTEDQKIIEKAVSVGSLDPLFWDNITNNSNYTRQLTESTITPHGNRLIIGNYPDLEIALRNTIRFTFDSIAVPPGLRLIIYSGKNFTGLINLDVSGPIYIANYRWAKDPRYYWAMDDVVWKGKAGEIFPKEKRIWSNDDTHFWKGSASIISLV